MRRAVFIIMAVVLTLGGAAQRPGVGLVLSGGGAKGIAHMGFIKALEENEIPIDCISGTSMGAIVGSLYAAGMTPDEMLALVKSEDFLLWSSGRYPTSEHFSFVAPQQSARWIGVNVALSNSAQITDAIPTRLIYPLPMSYAFMKLYSPYTGACGGDFDRLMVPLRTVASDIWTHKSVVFSHGELAEAVRASMSFPFVFQPIEVNGNVLFDGGLYDVYPVDVMMSDFNPERVIGVNLSSPNTKPTLNNLIDQMECMVMNEVDYPFPDSIGVNIRFDLERYGLLDWGDADAIFDYGYRRGLELADTLLLKVPQRRSPIEVGAMRQAFAKRVKPVVFDSVTVGGTTPDKARYISYLLTLDAPAGQPVTMDQVRSGFYRVASTGRLRNFVPHAVLDTATDSWRLAFSADVDRDYKFGVGGYLTSATGSMLYGEASYDPFALGRPGWSFQGWGGPNYLAALMASHINLASSVPSRLFMRIGLTQTRLSEKERMFYDFAAPSFLRQNNIYIKAGWERAAGRHGTFSLGVAYAHETSRYHVADPTDPLDNGTSRIVDNLAVLTAGWEHSTLDAPYLASKGTRYEASAAILSGTRQVRPWGMTPTSPSSTRADLHASALSYFHIGNQLSLGLGADAYWSTRKLLDTYTSSVVSAASFAPLPSGFYLFDTRFRANQWLAPSVHPVFDISRLLQARADCWLFVPLRAIEHGPGLTARYGKWFATPRFMGELSFALRLPFGNIRAYVDYRDSNASRWSAGIAFGLLLRAPTVTE